MKRKARIITFLLLIAFGTSTPAAYGSSVARGSGQNSNTQGSGQNANTQPEKESKEAERQRKKEQKEEAKRLYQQAAVRCARLGKKP